MSIETRYCRYCGRKVQQGEIAGICSTCGDELCSSCVQEGDDGRYYCPDHVPPPPAPPEPPQASSRCFIATAAYGTQMTHKIQVFREFRDQRLLPNRLGQWIVEWYYRTSPPFADRIQRHPTRRRIVRAFLDPLVRVFRLLGY